MPDFDIESLSGLHETLKQLIKAHDDGDLETERSILTAFVKREQAAYQRKLKLLAELKTLKQEARAAKEAQRKLARLVTLYKFAADLRAIGEDDLDDQETAKAANQVVHEVSTQLRTMIPEGAAALEALLDDASPNVRAYAGFSLIATLPAKVIPILEEIEHSAGVSSAWFIAHFALIKYRSEHPR